MRVPSSYRDPNGHVFSSGGEIFRQVNLKYQEHYDSLMESGLYNSLTGSGLLVRHQEVSPGPNPSPGVYKILKPEPVPFISYPYEWCFSQLKDAALATLQIQKTAMEFGMSLKDCSAYNIQFLNGKPTFIDTLSFEKYLEGEPWVAYRQFCQHFLAPLALAAYRHIGVNRLLQAYINGIPLDLARSLLPGRTRLKPSLQIHIHLQARFQDKFAGRTDVNTRRKESSFKRSAFLGLIDSLESGVKGLRWRIPWSEWVDYYEEDSYTPEAFEHKIQLVTGFLQQIKPDSVWDLGANTGVFSRIASDMGIKTVAFDQDTATVERNYLTAAGREDTNLLPLVVDLASPSPKIGWANSERMDLMERGPAGMLLALALIHHLAIAGNVPLGMIAEFLRKLCSYAVVEFVPKEDPKVARLLSTREDIFPNYTQDAFEEEFGRCFEIQSSQKIAGSDRTLYLMTSRPGI